MSTNTVTIDARDFGADPMGIRCSAEATHRAVDAARLADRSRLVFPRGRYAFRQENAAKRELYVSNTVGADPRYRDKRIGILVEGAEDLTIDGDGSTLMFHGTQTMIAILDSRRVTVTNAVLDFVRPTVIDATVVDAGIESGRAYRELTVPDCTAFFIDGRHVSWTGEDGPEGDPLWTMQDAGEYCQVLDPFTGITRRTSDPVFRDVLGVSRRDARIRIEYTHGHAPDDVGAIYQYRTTTRDHPGVAILNSDAVSVQGLSVHLMHGFGVVAQNGRDLRVRNCDFRPPEGTGRVTAGFADFLQCSGMAGTVDVQDCTFSGAHDDPINIHGTYLRIAAMHSSNELELEYVHPESAGFDQFALGDLIEIVDADLLRPLASALSVTHVSQPTGRDHAQDLRRMTVRVHPSLSEDVRTHPGRLAVENITRTPDVAIVRCHFSRVPTRGVLVTTRRRIQITDSVFERIPMASIFISSDADEWWESGPVSDVLVARNRFIGAGAALVEVAPTVRDVDERYPVHGRIRLEDNTVEESSDVILIRARSVRDITVSGTALPEGAESAIITKAVQRLTINPFIGAGGNATTLRTRLLSQ